MTTIFRNLWRNAENRVEPRYDNLLTDRNSSLIITRDRERFLFSSYFLLSLDNYNPSLIVIANTQNWEVRKLRDITEKCLSFNPKILLQKQFKVPLLAPFYK